MNGAAEPQCYWGVVPAAGVGERMGAGYPKQYLPLADSTVIEQTLKSMLSWDWLQGVMVALHADDCRWPDLAVASDPRIDTVIGGQTRAQSVLSALAGLEGRTAESDWVLVHDAARPCISLADVEKLRQTLAQDSVGGLLALPLAETLKRGNADGLVDATLDRSDLWLAQTPQMFRYGMLRDCLAQALAAGSEITDESSAMEMAGFRPRLVEAASANLKITQPADLVLAEKLLARVLQ